MIKYLVLLGAGLGAGLAVIGSTSAAYIRRGPMQAGDAGVVAGGAGTEASAAAAP